MHKPAAPGIQSSLPIRGIALLRAAVSVLFCALFLLAVRQRCGIYFESNDDRYIAGILSGTITGRPDFHTNFVSFWLGGLLSLLYQWFPSVPWWGGFLMLMLLLSSSALLSSSLSNLSGRSIRELPQILLILAGAWILSLSCFSIPAQLQFTSVSILLAISGYGCLLLHREESAGLALYFALELCSCFIREQAMLLAQPFGFSVLLCLYLARQKDRGASPGTKDISPRRPTFVCALLLAVAALSLAGNLIAGKYTEEWRTYESFNRMRVELFDYSGKPSYAEVASLLEPYGVTERSWNAFTEAVAFDWPADPALNDALIRYAKERAVPVRPAYLLERLLDLSVRNPSFDSVKGLWILLALSILLRRRWDLLVPGTGLLLARTAVWGYLAARGRILDRVTIPLFFCEGLMLLILLGQSLAETEAPKRARPQGFPARYIPLLVIFAGLALLLRTAFLSGRAQYRYLSEVHSTQDILAESLSELRSYCDSHPENRYLIDQISVSSVTGSASATGLYGPANYAMTGGWFTMAPNFLSHLREYLAEDGTGFCYIVYDFGYESPTYAYLEERSRCPAVLTDRLEVATGGVYLVYFFERSPF